jgi:hypothetical protein
MRVVSALFLFIVAQPALGPNARSIIGGNRRSQRVER